MAINKVVVRTSSSNTSIIDLTQDTVTRETLYAGVTAHDNTGEEISGAAVASDIILPLSTKDVIHDNGTFLSVIVDNYILDIDYERYLAFDTSEIVVNNITSPTLN